LFITQKFQNARRSHAHQPNFIDSFFDCLTFAWRRNKYCDRFCWKLFYAWEMKFQKYFEGLWLRLCLDTRAARQSGGLLAKSGEILRSWVQIPPGPLSSWFNLYERT